MPEDGEECYACFKKTAKKQNVSSFTATINPKEMGDAFITQTRRFIYISIRVFTPIGKFKHLQLCPRQMANKTSHKALSIL